jgi:hypothetical protein
MKKILALFLFAGLALFLSGGAALAAVGHVSDGYVDFETSDIVFGPESQISQTLGSDCPYFQYDIDLDGQWEICAGFWGQAFPMEDDDGSPLVLSGTVTDPKGGTRLLALGTDNVWHEAPAALAPSADGLSFRVEDESSFDLYPNSPGDTGVEAAIISVKAVETSGGGGGGCSAGLLVPAGFLLLVPMGLLLRRK